MGQTESNGTEKSTGPTAGSVTSGQSTQLRPSRVNIKKILKDPKLRAELLRMWGDSIKVIGEWD